MKSQCMRVGPHLMTSGLIGREHRDKDRHREGGYVTMEVLFGAMCLKGKDTNECQRLSRTVGNHQKLREIHKTISLRARKRNLLCQQLDLRPDLQNCERTYFSCFKKKLVHCYVPVHPKGNQS